MRWSTLGNRASAIRITLAAKVRDVSLDLQAKFAEEVNTKLLKFPFHWSSAQKAQWSKTVLNAGVTWENVTVGKAQRLSVVIRLEWRQPTDTPSDADWESYATQTFPQRVIPNWTAVARLFAGASFLAEDPNPRTEVTSRMGFQLSRVKNSPSKLQWSESIPGVPEIKRHPGNSLVIIIDEAASYFEPTALGGGNPNLNLFKAFVRDAPNCKVFYTTAGSDLATDLNILQTIVMRNGLTQPPLNPFRGLDTLQLPGFAKGRQLSFKDIVEQAGELLDESGGFNTAALYRIRNASKGLLSVATATNRDHFAEVVNDEPLEYSLPAEHADRLKAKIRNTSANTFSHAIICIDPRAVPPETLLRNQERFDPALAMRVFVEEQLLPGASSLLVKLRGNDARKFASQAVFSTLRKDNEVIDLYAAAMQAAGYRWIRAKKRSINRSQWSRADVQSFERRRAAGTLLPHERSVYLDFDEPFTPSVPNHHLGPMYPDRNNSFLVLSESLIVSDSEAVEPLDYAAMQQRVIETGETDTGFTFLFTMRELAASGLVMTLPTDTEEARRDLQTEFKTELRQIKKLHLHFWPGSYDAENIANPAILAALRKVDKPSYFVMKLVDGAFTPHRLDLLLSLAMYPNEPGERFARLRPALLFNFTMSEYEQRDLLTAVTEAWNNDAPGTRARIVLYGGNYSQGYDLKNTLSSIALHPSNRADELQSRGRTNRRDGMPAIPFRERVIHHSTLVAKWPGSPAIVSDVLPFEEDTDEFSEYRYGRMTEEKAVISSIYAVAAPLVASSKLTEDDPLEPYEVARCKFEEPAVTAFRQAGDSYYQDFAMDKPFNSLLRDTPDPINPDSEQPSAGWQYAPTQWSLKRRVLMDYYAWLSEELANQEREARQKAAESGESDEAYAERLLELARAQFSDLFDTLPEASRQIILTGLRQGNPQRLANFSEPEGVRLLRSKHEGIRRILDQFGDQSTLRIIRRLALESQHRYLLVNTTAAGLLRPTDFNLAPGSNTELLKRLVNADLASWNPDIQRIKTAAEMASEESVAVQVEVWFGAPMVIQAAPTKDEVTQAQKETKSIRPYSNALEALGILDDEQGSIEAADGQLGYILTNLGMWNAEKFAAAERAQLEAIYTLGAQPRQLKEAIVELSKFGATNWRKALALIAAVYTSERLAGKQSLLFVAQLIGTLFFPVRDSKFAECFNYARPYLAATSLNRVLEYLRLLFQWYSLYSPWDDPQLKLTFGLDLGLFQGLVHRFQQRYGLDLFADKRNLPAFKRALFMLDGKPREVPEMDIDQLAILYGTTSGVKLEILELQRDRWSSYNLKKFYSALRDGASFEEARVQSLDDGTTGLTRRYNRYFAIFVDGPPNNPPDPTKKWKGAQLIEHVLNWALGSELAGQSLLVSLADILRRVGISLGDLSKELAKVVDQKQPVAENRQRLEAWLPRWQVQVTILSRDGLPIFLDSEGRWVMLRGGSFEQIESVSMYDHFRASAGVIVARPDGFVEGSFINDLLDDPELVDAGDDNLFFRTRQFLALLVGKSYSDLQELVIEARNVSERTGIQASVLISLLKPGVVNSPLDLETVARILDQLQVFSTRDSFSQILNTVAIMAPVWQPERSLDTNLSFFGPLLRRLRTHIRNPSTVARFDAFFALGKQFGLSEAETEDELARAISRSVSGEFTGESLYAAMSNSLFKRGRTRWEKQHITLHTDAMEVDMPEALQEPQLQAPNENEAPNNNVAETPEGGGTEVLDDGGADPDDPDDLTPSDNVPPDPMDLDPPRPPTVYDLTGDD